LIRIVLGQRGRLWRGALAALLAQETDFEVLARPDRLEDVWPAVRDRSPHIVVLDAELPGATGLDQVCTRLCEKHSSVGVLILVERWPGYGPDLVRLAPRIGFLSADCWPAQLADGIRRLARGEPVLDAALAVAALSAGSSPLTDREREVLAKAVDGAPAKAIAADLYLSTGTVRNYLSRAIAKTGARSRFEAVRIARDEGWI
jgi:two-component system response regulator DesR